MTKMYMVTDFIILPCLDVSCRIILELVFFCITENKPEFEPRFQDTNLFNSKKLFIFFRHTDKCCDTRNDIQCTLFTRHFI